MRLRGGTFNASRQSAASGTDAGLRAHLRRHRQPSYAFVLPYFRDQLQRVSDMDELIARSDLRSVAGELRDNPKIRLFANRNDFLATPADLAWLTETLGAEHVTLFETGGHLGNLYEPEVQADIMASIADLLETNQREIEDR